MNTNQPVSSLPDAKKQHWLNRTVLGAGLTSALGDFGYETANVILPGFLAVLGIPPIALGAIEGIADATSSFTRMAAGYIADRMGIRKSLVVFGYALTPIGQALMALASGWPLILTGRVLGWFGRGVRGPLRDAIMAESITPETRGRAFGFHRAADTLGAVVGPLLGVALLSWAQGLHHADGSWPFRMVLWITLIPGLLGALTFAILVKDDRSVPNPGLRFWKTIRNLPVAFRRYLFGVGAFGIGDFAHTLLILAATQLLTPHHGVVKAAQIAGLLYVGRNLVQTVTAYPVGALADRIGHKRVLASGYALGALTALLMALAFVFSSALTFPLLLTVFIFAGVYVAVQDALEASLTAIYVPVEIRSLSYGILGSVNGIGDFISSLMVGVLWTAVSPVIGFGFAAVLMAVGTVAMARLPNESR